MRTLRVTLAALAIATTWPTVAMAADRKPCEDSRRRVFRLQVEGVGCEKARDVSGAYDRRRIRTGTFPSDEAEETRGFSCRARSTGSETYRIRCLRSGDLVTFLWGV